MAYVTEASPGHVQSGASRIVRFKQRLAAGETVIGSWLTIPELSVAEIMARTGFDYVIIDAEHSPWTMGQMQVAHAAFRGSDTVLMVRIPWNDPVYIKQVLDAGLDGIVCPMVRTAEEARQLVAACRYPPAGIRGFGPRRASDYYRRTAEYTANYQREVIISPQIEDAASLPEIDAILDVDGIDILCLGPTDLSAGLDHLGEFDHPVVADVLDQVLAKAKARNVAACTGIVLPLAKAAEWSSKGARVLLMAADTNMLIDASTNLIAATRKALRPAG